MANPALRIPFGEFFTPLFHLRFSTLNALAEKAGLSDTVIMKGLRFAQPFIPYRVQTALDILVALDKEIPLTDAEAVTFLLYCNFSREDAERWIRTKLRHEGADRARAANLLTHWPTNTKQRQIVDLCERICASLGDDAVLNILQSLAVATSAPQKPAALTSVQQEQPDVPMLKRTTERDGYRITEVHPVTPPAAPAKPTAKRKTS